MKTTTAIKKERRTRRHQRIRSKIFGTKACPRLSVHKSNIAIQAQLVDDEHATTMLAVRTDASAKKKPLEKAHDAGKKLAEEAKKQGIEKVVFDRGGFLYLGSVRSFAEGAREGGLLF